MATISEYMTADHRRCDELFVAAEEKARQGWQAAKDGFNAFREAMEHHFGREEETLFPLFEQRTGNTAGPTQVMRSEHAQMRGLFEEMAGALADENSDRYLGLCETLLIMMQQHNIKEEQILYPMTEQVLGAEQGEVLQRLAETV